MKYNEFKELLKKKAHNLKEIKIGLKEKQRVFHFNSYGHDGKIYGRYVYQPEKYFTGEQLRRRKLAIEGLDKCCESLYGASHDYRARHIALSLFRGRTPEQIENNYYDGKWDFLFYDRSKKKHVTFQSMIDKHLEQLERDNPPKTYYHEFVEESKEQYEKYFKEVI